MRTVVTGGAGFIGHHVVHALVAADHDVVVVDNFSTGDASRLTPLAGRIAVVEGDIRDLELLRFAFKDAEVVFHLAALPSVARSVADPLGSTAVNVSGTVTVMLAAADAEIRRVVAAGSSSVYGNNPEMPRRETQRLEPQSPYAATKAATEFMVHSLGGLHRIETVVLRYFNVFGPGQDPNSQYSAVIPRWITAALEGRRPLLFGDGLTSRDFTYVDNVVHANILASAEGSPSGGTYNIACGDEFTLLDLLNAIGAAVGVSQDPVVEPTRPGDVRHSRADITLATAELGYRVLIPFEEGIVKTVAWYRSVLEAVPA